MSNEDIEILEKLRDLYTKRRDAFFQVYPVMGKRGVDAEWAIRLVNHKKVFHGMDVKDAAEQALYFLSDKT